MNIKFDFINTLTNVSEDFITFDPIDGETPIDSETAITQDLVSIETNITQDPVSIDSLADNQGNMIIRSENGDTQTIINLREEFEGDNILSLEGETGEKIIVPEGYDYALFIKDGQVVEERRVAPGEELEFQSSILMGNHRKFKALFISDPYNVNLEHFHMRVKQFQVDGTNEPPIPWQYYTAVLKITGSMRVTGSSSGEFYLDKNINYSVDSYSGRPVGPNTAGMETCFEQTRIKDDPDPVSNVRPRDYVNYTNYVFCRDLRTDFPDKIGLINQLNTPVQIFGNEGKIDISTNHSSTSHAIILPKQKWLDADVVKSGDGFLVIEPEWTSFCQIRITKIQKDIYGYINSEGNFVYVADDLRSISQVSRREKLREGSWSGDFNLIMAQYPEYGKFSNFTSPDYPDGLPVRITNVTKYTLSWSVDDFKKTNAKIDIAGTTSYNRPSSEGFATGDDALIVRQRDEDGMADIEFSPPLDDGSSSKMGAGEASINVKWSLGSYKTGTEYEQEI